jgi:hypothetical protein
LQKLAAWRIAAFFFGLNAAMARVTFQRGIAITTDSDDHFPRIAASEGCLHQVVTNLAVTQETRCRQGER